MTDTEIFAQAVQDVMNKRGGDEGACTYTPVTGATPITTTVILSTMLDLQPDSGSLGTYISTDTLTAIVPAADLNSYDPREGDLITMTETSDIYVVQSKIQDDGYYITLSIIKR